MDNQTRKARESVKNLSFGEKIKHFYTYYKVPVIIGIVVLVFVILFVRAAFRDETYDLRVAYYGAVNLTDKQRDGLIAYLETVAEDVDGDGKITVQVDSFGGDDGMGYSVAIYQTFLSDLNNGRYSAYILDKVFFGYIKPDQSKEFIESYFEIAPDCELRKYLPEQEETLYWCSRILQEKEKGDEKKELYHNHALSIERKLRAANEKRSPN